MEASGLRSGQTRIPERPDQTDFLERWYEFHRGYRIVTKDDGTEERIAVLGEDFRDVSPGFLPRTLEELRERRERSAMEEHEREVARRILQEAANSEQAETTAPSLEETLDQMFDAASLEEGRPPVATRHVPESNNIHAQAMAPAASRNREYQARRVAALRRELHRMRNGIERVITGLRDLGQDVPDHSDASNRLSNLGQTLDDISAIPDEEEADRAIASVNVLDRNVATTQTDRTLANAQIRIDEARQQMDEAERNRDQARAELDLAEQEFRTSQSRLRRLQQEQRTAENYMRLFGTREEMAAQGENYESPIGGMFTRAYERFHVAEEVRREERTLRQVLEDEARSGGEEAANRLNELEARSRDVWGVPRPPAHAELRQTTVPEYTTSRPQPHRLRGASPGNDLNPRGDELALEEYYGLLRRQNWSSEAIADGPPETPAVLGSAVSANEDIDTTSPGPNEARLRDRDRELDARFVLISLLDDDTIDLPTNVAREDLRRLLQALIDSNLGDTDKQTISELLASPDVAWKVGLPAERNRRRRARGEAITFSEDAFENATAGIVVMHNVECMAEAFQQSAQVRSQAADLTGPARLAMCYRLQHGQRNIDDHRVLVQMLRSDATIGLARDAIEQNQNRNIEPQVEALQRRREAVRQGDHSRAELDASRQATRTLALAAGRAAFRAGPAALLEQMANRDEATRAAYDRLQENGFTPSALAAARPLGDTFYRTLSLHDFNASPTATDSEPDSDDDAKGLDAKDTGRPEEPLDDEQMTFKLDCQICYTQLADIACLPCGHLVMCKWCSEQHSPTLAHDKTRPRRAAGCPVCRKAIRQKVRVFRSLGT